MRPRADVDEAFRLLSDGLSQAEVARRVGISRATVRDWARSGRAAVLERPYRTRSSPAPTQACPGTCLARAGLDGAAYAYLLGHYLGDGSLARSGRHHRLRLFCADAHPNIAHEVARAVRRASGKAVRTTPRQGGVELHAAWAHWPCFLPHGPDHPHTVALADWQRELAVERNPGWLVRGLLQADGTRTTHRAVVDGRTYQLPRYALTARSPAVRALFLDALGRLGIEARPSGATSVSVTRRAAVAHLDSFVGPKS
jgi:hypothetical protein